MGGAALQGRGHIAQSGCAQRGDQPQPPWKGSKRALTGGVKQALGFQLGLDAQKGLVQRALPGATHAFHNQLQIAARLINGQAARNLDLVAIAGLPAEQAGGTAEHGTAQLPLRIFQGEIAMPAGGAHETCDFALHPHGAKTGV